MVSRDTNPQSQYRVPPTSRQDNSPHSTDNIINGEEPVAHEDYMPAHAGSMSKSPSGSSRTAPKPADRRSTPTTPTSARHETVTPNKAAPVASQRDLSKSRDSLGSSIVS